MSRAWAAVKLHARALAHPLLTRSWLALLNSHGALRELAHLQPRLLHKIYRPYLSMRLSRRQGLTALAEHYRFVVTHGLAGTVARATLGPVGLAGFNGKSGVRYHVDLRAIVPMEREGELVLQLRCGSALIQSVAFSFLFEDRQASIGIGCLQGAKSGAGLALAREATRDLHGLRPKNLLLRLVQQLGHSSGCTQMLLVGNENRVVPKQIRQGRVHADYDAFWQEMGAQARDDGDYMLACEPLLPPIMEQIASKKRSETRKRHELLAGIAASVISAILPGAVPVLS
ncbi:DUF535 family protein [Duganella violaceipulchra]|uniref:Uncharacterized protein VirK/YbjX n=1 Tax=Duganella violaceipulchra TaxID=2849652 RepID=A0AA41L454_9BURK|nr:DUF535 family protein [Duganella violaceicalia]MBV6322509.1 VirK/YbjX family protein [Duganella violaceicalia]MCP2010721.1 uncharacterized protein VirK/YbjX [Duganella violaceicalia]